MVRVRATPFWTMSAGDGCVGKTGRWTLVRADRPGIVRVSIGFSLGAPAGRRRLTTDLLSDADPAAPDGLIPCRGASRGGLPLLPLGYHHRRAPSAAVPAAAAGGRDARQPERCPPNKPLGHSWLPKGWPDALNQLALFALADLCYETVRGVAEGNSALAFANARWIVDAEQSMGLFVEQDFQAWVMGERLLVDFANFMYVNSHFIVTSCLLVWIYLRHNRQLLLRAQHVHGGDGAGTRRLSVVPDGSASLPSGAGIRRHDRLLRRRPPRLGASSLSSSIRTPRCRACTSRSR